MTNLFQCFGNLALNLFLVENWHVPYFLYHLLAFPNSSSARIESIICACFHIKLWFFFFFFCWKFTFQNYNNFSQISIVKDGNTSFANNAFCCLGFFRRGLTKPVEQLKTNRCRNSSYTETCTSSKTYRGESVVDVIATSYKTKLQN